MKVYLGGPIFNVSQRDAVAWRAKARTILEERGIGVNDPTERTPLRDTPGQEEGIILKDLEEIREADILIAYIPDNTIMFGTPMEIFFAAYVEKKPVFTFPKNLSPWIVHWSTETFDTLEDLLEHVGKNIV